MAPHRFASPGNDSRESAEADGPDVSSAPDQRGYKRKLSESETTEVKLLRALQAAQDAGDQAQVERVTRWLDIEFRHITIFAFA